MVFAPVLFVSLAATVRHNQHRKRPAPPASPPSSRRRPRTLKPYAPNKAELWVKELEQTFLSGQLRWHPFFESAYRGGGFTLGAGYLAHVGDYETGWTCAAA